MIVNNKRGKFPRRDDCRQVHDPSRKGLLHLKSQINYGKRNPFQAGARFNTTDSDQIEIIRRVGRIENELDECLRRRRTMMAYGRNRMARNRITTTTLGLPFITFSFRPPIELSSSYCQSLSRLWWLVIIILLISQSCECLVQMSSRRCGFLLCSKSPSLMFRRARIYVNNANRILNVSTAVYLLCNITGINGRVRWL